MKNKPKRRAATNKDLNKSILVDGELQTEDRLVYESSFAAAQAADEPLVDKIRAARRLGKDDFAVRINARG
jgi:anti-sigma factor RsiW